MKHWIFWLGFFCGLIEPVLRQIWAKFYFRYGIPLVRITVTTMGAQRSSEAIPDNDLMTKVETRPLGGTAYMIRRCDYGGVPRTFYRAYATINAEQKTCSVTLYAEFSSLLAGAFLSTVFVGESYASIFIGLAGSWLFHRSFIDKEWAKIIAESFLPQSAPMTSALQSIT